MHYRAPSMFKSPVKWVSTFCTYANLKQEKLTDVPNVLGLRIGLGVPPAEESLTALMDETINLQMADTVKVMGLHV